MAQAEAVVWIVVVLVAAPLGWTALGLPPPLTGRLHPGMVPAALALLALVALLVGLLRARRVQPEPDCLPTPAPSLRAMVAAVAAVVVLALGTHALGVLPAVFIASALAALGARGVSPARAALIGAGLAVLAAVAFVVLLRQPLPLLPGVW
jgi:uncharacterized membrane protein